MAGTISICEPYIMAFTVRQDATALLLDFKIRLVQSLLTSLWKIYDPPSHP